MGPHEVLDLLGAGGMGEVCRAKDPRLGREVAIKVLPTNALGNPDRLRRFEQEARAAGSLNHPNVVAIFETGIHEGAPGRRPRERDRPPLPEAQQRLGHPGRAREAPGLRPTARGPLPWALPTPDGRAYVYSYRRTLSDLYVVEGLR